VSNTPAAQLARLKVVYPTWTITKRDDGSLHAVNGKRRVEAQSVASLERKMLGLVSDIVANDA
jgi:hypothetical protein